MPEDFFAPLGGEPTNPGFKPPDLKKTVGMPKLPEAERLYNIQNNLLRALNSTSEEGKEHFLRQSYKGIVSYLKEHG